MNKRTKQFYQIRINLDYYFDDEYSDPFLYSFFEFDETIEECSSIHYDLFSKVKPGYDRYSKQIDCGYCQRNLLDQE